MKLNLACFILLASFSWASIASADNNFSESFYLENLKENQTSVSIFLVNGIKLQGKIAENTKDVILLQNTEGQEVQLVYKHAISTIVPSKAGNWGVRVERLLLPMYQGGTTIELTPSPLSASDVELQVIPSDRSCARC